MKLVVVCPSRGRPGSAAEMAATFHETAGRHDTGLVVAADSDDTTLDAYAENSGMYELHVGPSHGSMIRTLNEAGHAIMNADPEIEVLGFVGDDNRFRTEGWDEALRGALISHPGVAFGNDTHWGGRLPTAWFLSRPVVAWFGMAYKELTHLFADNYWRDLADAAGCLTYLPDVIIEHMHPAFGKGQWDEGYRRVNSEEVWRHDELAYHRWRANAMMQEASLLRELVEGGRM